MSDNEPSVSREVCDAHREGCQGKFLAKLEATNARIDTVAAKVDGVAIKVDNLKFNEVAHLQKRLEDIRKERREPLGRKEWGIIIVAVVTAASAIVVELVRGLR